MIITQEEYKEFCTGLDDRDTVSGNGDNQELSEKKIRHEAECEEVSNNGKKLGIEQECERLRTELTQVCEKNTYLAADLDTLRRRYEKDRREAIEQAEMGLLKSVLPVLDDFERAFAQQQVTSDLEVYKQGFALIYKQLQKVLKQHQVEELDQMTYFDPEIHEAVMQSDDPTKESGNIVTTLQKGYRYKNRLLRPAHVTVKP